MAVYDHKYCVLTLNGYELGDFAESGNVVSINNASNAGEYTIGATGKGVWVASGNQSGTLTIQLLQHSKDNAYLDILRNQQINSLKSFTPLEMYFKDTLNGDEAVGYKGYFREPVALERGTSHNAQTYVIVFERLTISRKAGLHN